MQPRQHACWYTRAYVRTRAYAHAYHVGTGGAAIGANMLRTGIHVRESWFEMASNVTTKIENGKLVIVADLNSVVRRTSKDTGDVLAAIDFEKLSALCPNVTGAQGEIKVSFAVYFMDKARQAATGAPAQASKRPEDMSKEELLALLARQAATTPTPAPTPKAPTKPPTEKQIAARQAFAERAKAGTLKPPTK